MKALFFEPKAPYAISEAEINSFTLIDGMYIRTPAGLSPTCYYFPLEMKSELEQVARNFLEAQKMQDMAMKSLYQVRNLLHTR